MKTRAPAATPDIRPGPALHAVRVILNGASLPSTGLTATQLAHFFFAGSPDSPAGLVGLELHGEVALLRSLAVTPAARTAGLGTALVAHAEGYARSRAVVGLYLLTTTAEAFFARRGYARIDRERAPTAIRATPEFSELCPSSSALMFKRID